MSKFFGYLITLVSFIFLFWAASYAAMWVRPLIFMCIFFPFVVWYLLLVDDLGDFVVFKYRIQVKKYSVHAHYLGLSMSLIPWWKPVAEKHHSYKSQNIFGADRIGGFDTEIEYKTEADVREAIEEHKREVRKQRAEFFKRRVKEKIKTTYL